MISSGLENKFGNHYTLENLPKSRRRKGPADPKTEENVVTLEKFMSMRKIAKKFGVSVRTVQNVKKRNGIKTYKKQRIPKRSEEQIRA
mgnify:FL=1